VSKIYKTYPLILIYLLREKEEREHNGILVQCTLFSRLFVRMFNKLWSSLRRTVGILSVVVATAAAAGASAAATVAVQGFK